MNSKKYPKILIIGNSINLHWGGGITLYNLLKGWPKDKIAIAGKKIEKEGTDICNLYYRLGYDEYKRPWPLNYLQPYYESGEVVIEKADVGSVNFRDYDFKSSKYNRKLKQKIEATLHFFGLYYFFFPLNISKKILLWIKEYQPDLIYTQIPHPDYINFIKKIYQKTKIPVVIHIMDDWPLIINKSGLSRIIWYPKFQRNFRKLLGYSNGLLSICQAMSDEYKNRYNKIFVPFHNCIDLHNWHTVVKESYEQNGVFKVLYAGRVGQGTSTSIFTVAMAIEQLAERGDKIELHLQVRELPKDLEQKLEKFKSVKRRDFVPYEKLPEVFRNADLLLLPMDFDKENLDFIHLSMPTKVPEYMISGTPILVFAHESTALYRYAKSEHWAFTESENNESKLAETIKQIYDDSVSRKRIAQRALEIAHENHEGEKVRNEFSDYLFQISEKAKKDN